LATNKGACRPNLQCEGTPERVPNKSGSIFDVSAKTLSPCFEYLSVHKGGRSAKRGTRPTEGRTRPTEGRTRPTEGRTRSTERRTRPTERRTRPTERRTRPTERAWGCIALQCRSGLGPPQARSAKRPWARAPARPCIPCIPCIPMGCMGCKGCMERRTRPCIP
jgi:hypothetical protein